MKNPFKRKPKTSTTDMAAPPTAEQEMQAAMRRRAEAERKFARDIDRRGKMTVRMMNMTGWLVAGLVAFELFWLGYQIAERNYEGAILSGFFVVLFGLMLAGRLADLMYEARSGSEMTHEIKEKLDKWELESKLEKAKAEGRKEAEEAAKQTCNKPCDTTSEDDEPTIGDIADLILDDDDAPEELKRIARVLKAVGNNGGDLHKAHDNALGEALQMVTEEVMDEAVEKLGGSDAAKAKGFEPGKEHATEIRKRFNKLTGHDVKLSFVSGRGWNAEIDAVHGKNHKPGRSPRHEEAATRADSARAAVKKSQPSQPKIDNVRPVKKSPSSNNKSKKEGKQ